MDYQTIFIYSIVAIALIFDFINGFHDAANSIATVVSTRVLSPQAAVVWAATFNFAAYFVFGVSVATTIGKGIVDASIIDPNIVFAALMGAIVWNLITWYYGIPSSSSHALIGGLVGSGIAKSGVHCLQSGLIKTAVSIVLSPTIGFIIGIALMTHVSVVFFKASKSKVESWARKIQLISSACYSLGHGGNDAQKTAGIIAVLLYSTGHLKGDFHVPAWVVFSCYFMMGFGTLFGGWKIVRTMGLKITKLKPIGGCCAELSGSVMLFAATGLGIPVSTTHTITGSIMGVGSVNGFSAVRWGIAERIVWAWVLTIPAAATVSALTWWALHYFNP